MDFVQPVLTRIGRFVEDPWQKTIKLIDLKSVFDDVVQNFAGSMSLTENRP